MSTQGNKLKAIADAIREKDGTTEPIVANTFPDRIRAIQTGGDVQVETMTITSMPTKLTYNIGETFDPTGISVTIKLNNGYTFVANDEHLSYGIDGAFTSAGSQTVPVRFSWGSEITEKTISVTVNRITLTVPVQSGTLTYNGNEQSPTWSGYDSTKMSISGMTSSTNAGSFVATFTLIGNNYQWTDGSTGSRNVSWTIDKASSEITLNAYSVTLDKTTLSATVTVLVTGTSGAISVLSSDSTVATAVLSGDTITISSVNDKTGNVTVTVSAAEDANHLAPEAKTIAVAAKFVSIYGVEWDGTSTTKWTRTDASANFADPVPYVAGATEYGSPFDDLMPWAGMTVSERTGGTMVAIPKFWYNLTQLENNGLKIQIADGPVEGFYPSPAHMDRGDGKGERDMVFIGRYKCSASNYKSVTKAGLYRNVNIATARTKIHNLGENIWQFDFCMLFTIWLLYLVEFADWNSQNCIGLGGNGTSSFPSIYSSGYTDIMPYHTGTTKSNRDAIGPSIQYRNIEGLWENLSVYIEGLYTSTKKIVDGLEIEEPSYYIVLNPQDFADKSKRKYVGYLNIGGGVPSAYNLVSVQGFSFFVPKAFDKNDNEFGTYSSDYFSVYENDGTYYCFVSGAVGSSKANGLFYVYFFDSSNSSANGWDGSRLMELP